MRSGVLSAALIAASLGGRLGSVEAIADGPRYRAQGGRITPRGKPARARIPKAFRQHAKRYAGLSPEDVLQAHAKFPAPMLDHWRNRGNAMRQALGYSTGERMEWR